MQWFRALTDRLPKYADDPTPDAVDWSRGVIAAVLAFICFSFAAIALIVSDAFASAPIAAVFIMVGVVILCAQPAARVASANLHRVRVTERVMFVIAAAVGLTVTLILLGTWVLWIALAGGLLYACIRGILLAVRVVRPTHSE